MSLVGSTDVVHHAIRGSHHPAFAHKTQNPAGRHHGGASQLLEKEKISRPG